MKDHGGPTNRESGQEATSAWLLDSIEGRAEACLQLQAAKQLPLFQAAERPGSAVSATWARGLTINKPPALLVRIHKALPFLACD